MHHRFAAAGRWGPGQCRAAAPSWGQLRRGELIRVKTHRPARHGRLSVAGRGFASTIRPCRQGPAAHRPHRASQPAAQAQVVFLGLAASSRPSGDSPAPPAWRTAYVAPVSRQTRCGLTGCQPAQPCGAFQGRPPGGGGVAIPERRMRQIQGACGVSRPNAALSPWPSRLQRARWPLAQLSVRHQPHHGRRSSSAGSQGLESRGSRQWQRAAADRRAVCRSSGAPARRPIRLGREPAPPPMSWWGRRPARRQLLRAGWSSWAATPPGGLNDSETQAAESRLCGSKRASSLHPAQRQRSAAFGRCRSGRITAIRAPLR